MRFKPGLEGRLQVAGMLAMAGLAVEWISLLVSGPGAFLVFLFAGGSLIGAGVLFYLYSMATKTREVQSE